MPESTTAKGRTSSQRSTASSRSAAAPQVRVRYYRRMRPYKVYPVTVDWKAAGRGTGGPVVVRLVVAGAQVVPTEQTLNPENPDDNVTFYVTPIARGRLRGERLEVVQDGRKVQEIRLPCKATTQRLTWFFLLLTILVAWWIVPLIVEPVKEPRPQTDEQKLVEAPLQYEKGSKAMALRLERHLPHVLPAIEKHLPQVAKELEKVPDHVGNFVALAHHYQTAENLPVAEGLLGLLILVTLLSWWTHLERRKSRIGKPLTVGGRADED